MISSIDEDKVKHFLFEIWGQGEIFCISGALHPRPRLEVLLEHSVACVGRSVYLRIKPQCWIAHAAQSVTVSLQINSIRQNNNQSSTGRSSDSRKPKLCVSLLIKVNSLIFFSGTFVASLDTSLNNQGRTVVHQEMTEASAHYIKCKAAELCRGRERRRRGRGEQGSAL